MALFIIYVLIVPRLSFFRGIPNSSYLLISYGLAKLLILKGSVLIPMCPKGGRSQDKMGKLVSSKVIQISLAINQSSLVPFYFFFSQRVAESLSLLFLKKTGQSQICILSNNQLSSSTLFHSRYFKMIILLAVARACLQTQNQVQLVSKQPSLIGKTNNGQLYYLGNGSNYLYLMKLKGNAYEMGLAYGQLFKQKLKEQVNTFFSYMEKYLQTIIKVPEKYRGVGGKLSLWTVKKLLALNVIVTRKYTNKRIFQQIRGIAKGSGANFQELLQMNIYPQFVKAACTVLGVWGPATFSNKTLHMRALDWDKNFPINKYPVAVIYQSTQPGSKKYVNIGYLGLIGVLTGLSQKVSIGEKIWITPKNSMPTTRFGEPWTYVLRDVVQFANNLQQATQMLRRAKRTCTIHLGVGSKVDKSFRMVLYSQKNITVFDDQNYTHYGDNHPKMQGVAYWDKHVQPSSDSCLGKYIKEGWANWTAQSLWRKVGASHQTGDTQLVVFELQSLTALISYSQYGTGVPAFKRAPLLVDFKPFFLDF